MLLQLIEIPRMRERSSTRYQIHILVHLQLQANQFFPGLGYTKVLVIANQQHAIVVHHTTLTLLTKGIDGKRHNYTLLQELIIAMQVVLLASHILLTFQAFRHFLLIAPLHQHEKSRIAVSGAKFLKLGIYAHCRQRWSVRELFVRKILALPISRFHLVRYNGILGKECLLNPCNHKPVGCHRQLQYLFSRNMLYLFCPITTY